MRGWFLVCCLLGIATIGFVFAVPTKGDILFVLIVLGVFEILFGISGLYLYGRRAKKC